MMKNRSQYISTKMETIILINVAKTSSTYMKIFLVGRIIGVPVKWRTCTLLVSLRLHLGFLSRVLCHLFWRIFCQLSIQRPLTTKTLWQVVKSSPWSGLVESLGSWKKLHLWVVSSDFRDEDVEWKGQQQWLHWHTLRWYNLVIYINWLDEIGYNVAIPL